ncbi:hypothetical protein BpHYR1_042098 [Brachionus plicatilis]|uniref:Uncharacterized protein n=1 Tax=Brachionus plicatilis TaxID=10195 RepID=A0A3M7PZY0_BRAPC|nr:hypothetical protein BpHYR1_042098 [Brachionus plicatilis]
MKSNISLLDRKIILNKIFLNSPSIFLAYFVPRIQTCDAVLEFRSIKKIFFSRILSLFNRRRFSQITNLGDGDIWSILPKKIK